MWVVYAFGSAFFAGVTSVLAKIGIQKTDSNLATALRTAVVLLFSWIMVGIAGSAAQIMQISAKSYLFLALSGLATGASWLCYYKALRDGLASIVVPVDKLSIVVSVAFSTLVLHEKLTRKAFVGLALIIAGTLGMVFFS